MKSIGKLFFALAALLVTTDSAVASPTGNIQVYFFNANHIYASTVFDDQTEDVTYEKLSYDNYYGISSVFGEHLVGTEVVQHIFLATYGLVEFSLGSTDQDLIHYLNANVCDGGLVENGISYYCNSVTY